MIDIKPKVLGLVNSQNLLGSEFFSGGHSCAAMRKESFDAVLVGRRLEAIRLAKGVATQEEFASRIGVSKNRYNNWAVGVGPIPVPIAAKVRAITGATLDYIYMGDLSGMPISLVDALQEAEASIPPPKG